MTHTKKLETLNFLRKLCQGAVIFGFVTSAAGNVLHAVQAFTGHHPVSMTIAIAIAVLIPTIFGIMFEISTRVFFRKEAHWVMKLIAFTGAAAISGITAWNSYFHQRDAFSNFGDETQATLLPLAIDGLMIIGSVYLIELGFQIRDLEAWIAAGGNTRKVKEDVPPPPVKDKEPTKKERIIQLLAQTPELDAKAISDRLGISYNYAFSVAKELRAKETNPVTV